MYQESRTGRYYRELPSLLFNASTIRRYCLWVLFLWLFLSAFVLIRLKQLLSVFPETKTDETPNREPNEGMISEAPTTSGSNDGLKILYIVTSMADTDNGQRNTVKGTNRFQETLIPVISEAVQSMLISGYQVDLYLVSHYEVNESKRSLLRAALPETVGIQIWDDATPLGYAQPGDASKEVDHECISEGDSSKKVGQNCIKPITRALSRQHRYIIKDKLLFYDLFVNFEDDMMIRGSHVENYLSMTNELSRLKQQAPIRIQQDSKLPARPVDRYHGELTRIQLARLVPGFIRVEAIENHNSFEKGRQEKPMALPQSSLPSLDVSTCCHKTPDLWNQTITNNSEVSAKDIYLWETQTIALGLHKMPINSTLDWVVLQRGIDQDWIPSEKVVGEYWTGRDVIPKVKRPNPTLPQTINNQGGWMGTQDQVFAWHRSHCKGQFLPPYQYCDGLSNNVEYWSGGLNLVGMNACQLQRIVSLEPKDFPKHLVSHTTNNKQKSTHLVFTNIQTFWEQLHFVKLKAQKEIGTHMTRTLGPLRARPKY